MKCEIVGMEELIEKLHKYHEAPNRVGNRALKAAASNMLEHEQQTLRKIHNKDRSTGKGVANLKVGRIKTYSSGNKYVGVGFTKEMLGNWEDIKGAYFNHYGYHNNRGGKYIAGSNWLGIAFENGSSSSYEIIKATLLAELRGI